jgi:hypothetical protein
MRFCSSREARCNLSKRVGTVAFVGVCAMAGFIVGLDANAMRDIAVFIGVEMAGLGVLFLVNR